MILFLLWAANPTAATPNLGPDETKFFEAAAGDVQTLELGSSLERSFLRLEVQQQGADVAVRVEAAASGEAFRLADQPLGYREPERLLLPAGKYRVQITAKSSGRYSVRWTLARADEARFAADEAWTEATHLFQLDREDSRPLARLAFERAASAYGRLGMASDEARALASAGHVAADLGDVDDGLILLNRAIDIRREQGGGHALGEALHLLGNVHRQRRDLETANQAFTASLEVFRSLGDDSARSRSLLNLGFIAQQSGDAESARRHYLVAVELAKPHGDLGLMVRLLNNLGSLDYQAGEIEAAIGRFEALLELHGEDDRRARARTLVNLAAARRALGRYQAALEAYEQAYEIQRSLGDLRIQATTLNNLGFTYFRLGENERARAYFEQALPRRQKASDLRGEAVTINNLGRVALSEKKLDEASAFFHRSLELFREASDRRGQGSSLENLGKLELARGRLGIAEAHLRASSKLHRELKNEQHSGQVDALLARVLLAGERPTTEALDEAVELSTSALHSHRRLGSRESEAEDLWVRAKARRALGRRQQALLDLDAARSVAESLRVEIHSPDLRAGLLSVKRQIYEETVDLLMSESDTNKGRAEPWQRAFEVAEQARARGLLDLLSGVGRPGLSKEAKANRQMLLEGLAAAKFRLDRNRRRGKVQKSAIEAAAAELRRLSIELDQFQAPSEEQSRWMSPGEVLGTAEVQMLLDRDTALVTFALGDESSYVWVLKRDGLQAKRLPGRRILDERVRQVSQDFSTFNPRGRSKELQKARMLSEMLLLPVASELDVKRLAIVAEGSLLHLPFAALPMPGGEGLLVDHYEVVYLPSASLLPVLRARAIREPAAKLIAVVADPRFALSPSLEGGEDLGLRGSRRGDRLVPSKLPASRDEALKLAELAAGQADLWLGARARKNLILGSALQPYRFVHFATHAEVDSRRPELSSLALAFFDANGQAIDGHLRLHDIYELSLNADLVVLSGCETGLGRDVLGEGFLGLTRGFFLAGAARVAASLWRVEDRATAELMSLFYGNMLEHGLAPAAALRAAQLELRQLPRFRDPFFWAAFVMQGDWQTP